MVAVVFLNYFLSGAQSNTKSASEQSSGRFARLLGINVHRGRVFAPYPRDFNPLEILVSNRLTPGRDVAVRRQPNPQQGI
jgi:hypothetical protein